MKIAFKVRAKNGFIQNFLNHKGWSNSELARTLGMSPSYLGEIINMSMVPSQEYINRICSLLELPPAVVFPDVLKGIQGKHETMTLIQDVADEDLLFLSQSSQPLLTYNPDYEQKIELPIAMKKALNTLTEREREVLEMRFYEDRTLEDIGREIGVSRGSVSQIGAKALRKLRHPSRSKTLKPYYPELQANQENREYLRKHFIGPLHPSLGRINRANSWFIFDYIK